jgi:hypothetical protein
VRASLVVSFWAEAGDGGDILELRGAGQGSDQGESGCGGNGMDEGRGYSRIGSRDDVVGALELRPHGLPSKGDGEGVLVSSSGGGGGGGGGGEDPLAGKP